MLWIGDIRMGMPFTIETDVDFHFKDSAKQFRPAAGGPEIDLRISIGHDFQVEVAIFQMNTRLGHLLSMAAIQGPRNPQYRGHLLHADLVVR